MLEGASEAVYDLGDNVDNDGDGDDDDDGGGGDDDDDDDAGI